MMIILAWVVLFGYTMLIFYNAMTTETSWQGMLKIALYGALVWSVWYLSTNGGF